MMTSHASVLRPTFDRVLRIISTAADHVSEHPRLYLALLVINYLFIVLKQSLALPLWHDELFTYYISSAPTLHDLFRDTAIIDLNPPLSYLLTRASFHLFGMGTLQCRLPEMIAFCIALICIYVFVSRRAGPAAGVFAAALLLVSDASQLSVQARPYGMLIGFTLLALVAWQGSVMHRSEARSALFSDILLFTALVLLLCTHVFGLLAWGAILLAEATETYLTRRLYFRRLAALFLPLLSAWLYRPLLQNHATSFYPAAFVPTGTTIKLFYVTHLNTPVLALCTTTAVLVILGAQSWLRNAKELALTYPEWVAILVLFLEPGVLMVRLKLQHAAFFDRYGAVSLLAIAVLTSIVYSWRSDRRSEPVLIATVVVLLATGKLTSILSPFKHPEFLLHTQPQPRLLGVGIFSDPSLPIVDASGLVFVEMNYREPANVLSRIYYLTSRNAAIQFAHATIFEGMAMEKQMFGFQANVDAYEHFTAQHNHFYVLGTEDYPEDWLLRKLEADGAHLLLRGRASGDYKDAAVYEVTLPPSTQK